MKFSLLKGSKGRRLASLARPHSSRLNEPIFSPFLYKKLKEYEVFVAKRVQRRPRNSIKPQNINYEVKITHF